MDGQRSQCADDPSRWALYIQWGTRRRHHGSIQRDNVLYFCTVCRCIHPTEIYLPLEDGFLKMKTISEAYGGKVLPFTWQCYWAAPSDAKKNRKVIRTGGHRPNLFGSGAEEVIAAARVRLGFQPRIEGAVVWHETDGPTHG